MAHKSEQLLIISKNINKSQKLFLAMYSILKTQKRQINHKKTVSITSSIFITNNHILFTFSDCACVVYSLRLSSSEPQSIIWQGTTSSIVIESQRLTEGRCVLLGKHAQNIYTLEISQNLIQHSQQIKLQQMPKSIFADMVSNQQQSGLINTTGTQFKLHGFLNSSFIVQFFVYEDKKIILDCYNHKQIKTKMQSHGSFYAAEHTWTLQTMQVDIEINGHYVLEPINRNTGQLALYKQQEIIDAQWVLRVLSPFVEEAHINPQYPQHQGGIKEVRISLPETKFNEDIAIMQVCQYLNGSYLIIVASRTNGKLKAYVMHGVGENTVGNLPQNLFNFENIPQVISTFLNQNFIRMMYVNPKDQIFYALTHTHQRVDGQLYENGLIIGNLKNGSSIEKGYCSLKNIDFSPNHRYILDVPYEYENYGETFYHIRLLLSKSSLYMFLIENNKCLAGFSEGFKEIVVGLL